MSSIGSVLKSSIGQKFIMGLTGLFLISFLLVHLAGNTLLFKSDGGLAFNQYTRFMTTNSVIRVLEWVLFAGFIIHVAYAAMLTRQNRTARPQRYAFNKNEGKSSTWFSRNMGLSGTIVLAFLIIHLIMFWGMYKWGSATTEVTLLEAYEGSWKVKQEVSAAGVLIEKGSYVDFEQLAVLQAAGQEQTKVPAISMTEVVKKSFSQWYIVLLYVVAMGLLSLHLNHGFQSAFRSLGLVHNKYSPIIQRLGTAFAVVVPLLFAVIPVWFIFASM